jgi:hypothetical protein
VTELEEATAVGRAKDRRWAWTVGGTVLLLVSLALNVVAWSAISQRAQTAEEQAASLAQQVQAECEAGGELSVDGADLCERADDVAEANEGAAVGPAGPPGQRGEQGPAPSTAQVLQAVASYCAGGACRGIDGQDGSGPTPADVFAAVTQFCADGRCAGVDGRDGVDGADGTPGEPGRGPTAEEIAAAVTAYCANDACRGPAGADSTVPGPAGPPCPEGWIAETLTVLARDDATPTWQDITTCVAIGQ